MMWLFILISLILLMMFLAVPFFRKRLDELGVGLEVQDPSDRWTLEKNRLLTLIAENDRALQEGRIDPKGHQDTSRVLYEDAEIAMQNARNHRASYRPHKIDQTNGWLRSIAVVGVLLTLPLAAGVSQYASLSDINMNVSPHEDGRIPLTAQSSGSVPPNMPTTETGQPDIAKMVGRLEGRIADGDASREDYVMFLRSLTVVGRQDDVPGILRQATARFPNDLQFRMDYLRVSIDQPNGDNAELLGHVEKTLAQDPQRQEAVWYKGLLLHRLERHEEAAAVLRALGSEIPSNHPIQPQIKKILDGRDYRVDG